MKGKKIRIVDYFWTKISFFHMTVFSKALANFHYEKAGNVTQKYLRKKEFTIFTIKSTFQERICFDITTQKVLLFMWLNHKNYSAKSPEKLSRLSLQLYKSREGKILVKKIKNYSAF